MAKEYLLLKELDDNLMCPICHDVAINPVQEQKCGKLFCSKCKEELSINTCPCCKRRPSYFEDTKSKCECSKTKFQFYYCIVR